MPSAVTLREDYSAEELWASPMVFEADCSIPRANATGNAYCRHLELAQHPTLRSLGETAVSSAFKDAA